jgi:drug/metabolite transporter superfamily protein YnfA
MDIKKSVIFFLTAGLCEIGGGYLADYERNLKCESTLY